VKRFAAILIFMLLLFNWVGFQLYMTIAENRENGNIVTRLDNDQFSDADLISIKVPAVHLPPYVNEQQFERVNGQIEIGSRVFNYVKRRILQDSLEFLCIPNDQATLLRIAKYDFFKLVADLQAEQSKKTNSNNNNHKTLNGEYFPENSEELFAMHQWILPGSNHRYSAAPTAGFTDFRGQPPQLFC
jgi:hypothetical protein